MLESDSAFDDSDSPEASPSLFTPLVASLEQKTITAESGELFSSFVGYCFSLNYIFGVGVLGIPYALLKAGFIQGSLMILAVTFISWMSTLWILESMERAEAWTKRINGVRIDGVGESVPDYRVSQKKFEIVDLVKLFLGSPWNQVYRLTLAVYLSGALWSYASVFGSSFAANLPLNIPSLGIQVNGGRVCDIYMESHRGCHNLYSIYLAIFALFVIPLSCKDLKDQKFVQVCLSLFRFLTIALMVGTATAALAAGEKSSSIPESSSAGIISFLPVAVYSQLFHHSVPGLTQPLRHKAKAGKIYAMVMFSTFALYFMLSIVLGLFFGSSLEAQCTINWTKSSAPGPKWAAYIIVLFPAFDVISAFPLGAITLVNNILSEQEIISSPRLASHSSFVKYALRISVAAVPIVGAFLEHDLSFILKWCGFLGVMIAFIFPSLLNLFSRRACYAEFKHLGIVQKANLPHPIRRRSSHSRASSESSLAFNSRISESSISEAENSLSSKIIHNQTFCTKFATWYRMVSRSPYTNTPHTYKWISDPFAIFITMIFAFLLIILIIIVTASPSKL